MAEPEVPEHSPVMVRQVTWNFPKPLYERLEKVKAEGTKAGDIPPHVADESFGMFLLDRAISLYEAMLVKKDQEKRLVLDSSEIASMGEYVGTRTPQRIKV